MRQRGEDKLGYQIPTAASLSEPLTSTSIGMLSGTLTHIVRRSRLATNKTAMHMYVFEIKRLGDFMRSGHTFHLKAADERD